jgi:hypothetical protein
MKPTRAMPGAACLSSSSDFPNIEYSTKVKPVMLPLGRARLEMKPCPTGSLTTTKTTGVVRNACFTASRFTVPLATTRSGAALASCAA